MNCHRSIINNNQRVETSKGLSTDEWDEQNVVSPYTGRLFSHQKERSTDIFYNVDEP